MKRWEQITRAAALSLLMLFAVAAVLPLISSSAHSNNKPSASASKKRKLRRYSRAWWRRYRERQRRRRAAQLRKRALSGEHQRNIERQSPRNNAASSNAVSAHLSDISLGQALDSARQSTPTIATEHNSRPAVIQKGVRLNTPDGQTVGQVAVAVVTQARNGAPSTPASRRRALSGVPMADLRRMVIDKMLASGGWVVNDFEREINGRRVYVVLAQTATSNDRRVAAQSWNFYFTESEGQIYSIVSNAPVEFSDRMAVEAERVIATLGASSNRPADNSAQRR
ncbi:MAG TPA: hypothetical protein VM911_18880 [Pyrinomonadaceae bacterium]|jgi:hypothetical protein|nr:hypothetical protein [Pyrinomonadaceae bacterium]